MKPRQIEIRILRRITEQLGIRKFIVNSTRDSRRHYTVTRKSKRVWQCSCPRWIFGIKQPDGSRRRENCKHILSVNRVVGSSGK